MKKGDLLELEIEKYAYEGKGIAKIDKASIPEGSKNSPQENSKYVIFVNGAYPGDKVKAQLTKIKKSYAEAKAVEIISSSQLRDKARCKYFGVCGGCKQQDLNYKAQAKFKQQQVEEIFIKMGSFENFEVEEIIPSENIFFYRNKMEFSFAEKRWLTLDEINSGEVIDRSFALGLHIPNLFDKVLDIDECFLQSEVSNKILNFTRKFFKRKSVSIYSSKTNSGYLRNLVIKQSHYTKDLMVNLVTFYEDDDLMKKYSAGMIKEIPQITAVINNINLKKAMVATGDYEKVFYGDGFIFDTIGKYKFRISANSFFQTNSLQAEKLYQTALDFAGLSGREIVYDLYSGAGTISIFISDHAKEVYAFETVESAVNDAEENKRLNKTENVHFVTADLYKSFLPKIEEKKLPYPDVVILDPPRSGMHTNTVEDVIKLNPQKIVYVSCNPTTQVRDLKLFCSAEYKLIKIRPVDMFPHTYHIENVALLIKGKQE
ncbi:MAG: 23S rRNA (uracil(1939)-C(5))-methyltransferase RlmD [Ignavibacteriaceae bacterium]